MFKSSSKKFKSDPQKVVYTVSEARENLYNIVKDAAAGMTYEVTQREGNPVVIMSKEEFEGWQETLDIMSNPEEYEAIAKALNKKNKFISWEQAVKELGLEGDEDLL